MYKVLVEKTVAMPRKKLFDALMDFGGLETLMPDMVASCDVTGSGVGASRDIKLKDGGRIVERLDVAYGDTVFGYSITYNDAMPFENYCAVVTLEDAGSSTVARWGSNWNAKGATDAEVAESLTGLYTVVLDEIHKIA
jgi:hypothetical protein